MDSFWNSSNMLRIFMKWKFHILIITFLGMIIIGASTYLIKPKYKSSAIVYPINLGQYSDEEYSEQMIQMLNSRNIADSIIKKYNLPKHYEIDTAYKHFKTLIYGEYSENVSISKTQYDAVQIKALDTSPDTAALIVNSIIYFFNSKVRELHRLKEKEAMNIYHTEMNKWKNMADSINLEIEKVSERNNKFYSNGIQKVYNNNLKNTSQNATYNKTIKSQLITLNNNGGKLLNLEIEYIDALDKYNKNKVKYNIHLREYLKEITYSSVVTSPYPADKKSSPKRIVITLMGGFSVFILLIFIIGFIENKKKNI